jgi:hypothetical protein
LLEGTGKKLRHVKVQDIDEVAQTSLRQIVQTSLEERKKALGVEK